MQRCFHDFRKFTVAALAFLTPASTAWAAVDWRTVAVTIVNNTTTPAPAGQTRIREGFLPVSCDGRAFQPIQKDQTQVVRCSVRGTESLTLTYTTHLAVGNLHYGTANVDCTSSGTLTFTGSGQAVSYTKSCTDPDPDGDDANSDDANSDDNSDSGGDDSGGGGG